MKIIFPLSIGFFLFSADLVFANMSREEMFRFCESGTTMEVAEIGMNSVRLMGEEKGVSYYKNAVKKIYERASDSDWVWIEKAHDRIIESIVYYRQAEGRYMLSLDSKFISDSCELASPTR